MKPLALKQSASFLLRNTISLCASLCLVGVAQAAQALQLSDDQGHTLTLAHSPQRIVSLLPS
ncbi:MAG: hypothetical protein ORN28_06935, partial [Rhodoferax sp.]|nr:hypothetical protein [Rhodoferax sp.]